MPAAKVHRTDSLKSERSDASQNNKRVSFNNDVDVKHIPRGAVVDRQGRLVGYVPPSDNKRTVPNVYREPTALTEEQIAREAELIIKQVDQIACTVSPTPGTYDTRSLERKSKRNNQDTERKNWSKTLPSTSTKNKIEGKTTNNLIEKNVLNKNQVTAPGSGLKLDPILETSREAISGGDTTTTSMDYKDNFTPKYDSGIEMEAQHTAFRKQNDKPPLGRNNVNLIVKQLTEETRHRDHIRKKYEQDGIDMAPRMPVLSVVEPDPIMGLTHNKNLPFSYLDGSPTRRGSPPRQLRLSPPRKSEPNERHLRNDIIYAQVVVEDGNSETTHRKIHNSLTSPKEQSPERNFYLSNKGIPDKVPVNGKLFQTSNSQRKQDSYRYERDENEEDEIDAIKAKARFLFGDDSHYQTDQRNRYDEYIKEPSPFSHTDTTDSATRTRYSHQKGSSNVHVRSKERVLESRDITQQNNYRNEESKSAGMSYKYSSLLNDPAERENRDLRTKVLISTEPERQKERIFRYSDDDEYKHEPGSYNYFTQTKESSSSPEPVAKQRGRVLQSQISVKDRIRNYEVQSPESSPEREIRNSGAKIQIVNQQPKSSRLIQEVERGRQATRRDVSSRSAQTSHQRPGYTDYSPEDPPKPPVRTKKLRDRMEQNSPPRAELFTKTMAERNQNLVQEKKQHSYQWSRNSPQEYSPERIITSQKQRDYPEKGYRRRESPERFEPKLKVGNRRIDNLEERSKQSQVRYNDREENYDYNENFRDFSERRRSMSSSPERINVRFRTSTTAKQNENFETHPTVLRNHNPELEKQDKIKRQRSKFLAAFLGIGKQNKTKENQAKEQNPKKEKTILAQKDTVVQEQRDPISRDERHWEATVRRSDAKNQQSRGQYEPEWRERVDRDYSAHLRQEELKSDHKKSQARETHQRESKAKQEIRGQVDRVKWDRATNEVPTTSTKNLRSSESFHFRPDRNRSDSPYHTDSSEGEDVRGVPMKYARHKSKSYSNLHLRNERDENEAGHHQQWGSATLNRLEVRQRREEPRAYASTDVIRDRSGSRPPPIKTRTEDFDRANLIHDRNLRYFGDTDLESQQSSGGRHPRYASKAKVKRSASSAAGMGGVRKGLMARQSTQPIAVSSSLQTNSSESEIGSQASNIASGASAESGASQRSVYLHATTVADIPPAAIASSRRRVQSREDLSQLHRPPHPAPSPTGNNPNLLRTRQMSRSYSVLTPFKPRNVREKYEVSYGNQQRPSNDDVAASAAAAKPPRPPQRQRREDDMDETDLPPARPGNVVRSSTMPKDPAKRAGWFRKKKR